MIKNEKSVPITKLKYCTRCCFPETKEGFSFDEMGVCTACQSSEQKMHIDWQEREAQLREILAKAKAKSKDNYDCILPISGGKDSFFQAHILVEVYKVKPLAVTFSHNWFSETGFYNLQRCLEVFNLDHLQFTPARGLVNKLAHKSLGMIGDSCWHCHSGVGAFPLQVATRFGIPLLIYGESVSENDGRATYNCSALKFSRDYFTKVSAKATAEQMIDENLAAKDLKPFELPSSQEIKKTGVWGIHLGDFIFWDEEKQTEFVRDTYGWRETEMEGAYKGYKSAECIMSGVHDFTCYLKRGFGRATWQASVDVRNGLLTREEGFELIKKYDREKPGALDYYLKITGMNEREFLEIIKNQRHPHLQNKKIPVIEKTSQNAEKTVPFVQQIIQKHLKKPDPRIKKLSNNKNK